MYKDMKIHRLMMFTISSVLCLSFLLCDSKSINADEKYEIRPQINIPAYGLLPTTAGSYEHLMEQYITLTEANILRIDQQLENILNKLETIDAKLSRLSERMESVEAALEIRQQYPRNLQRKTHQVDPNRKSFEKNTSVDVNDIDN